jgi:ATP-dependent Clp protease ATP-binding subunit ClpX
MNTLHCSFCEKSQYDVRDLIAGRCGNICNECAVLSVEIAEENRIRRIVCEELEKQPKPAPKESFIDRILRRGASPAIKRGAQ